LASATWGRGGTPSWVSLWGWLRRFRSLDARAVEGHDLADLLDGGGAQGCDQCGDLTCPRFPVIAGELDLDDFVALEGNLGFLQHGIAQTLGADDHHRLQRMGTRLEGAAVSRGELRCRIGHGGWGGT